MGTARRREAARGAAAALATLATLATLALLAPRPARAEEMIRVLVADRLAAVRLTGEGLLVAPPGADGPGRPVGGRALDLRPDGGGLEVAGARGGPAVVVTARGPLRLGGRVLSSRVEVVREADGLAVVEELPIDVYVAGVVGGEMPAGFPPEALKAQAVAARSFALVRKLEAEASRRPWHLGASALSQVYAGGAPGAAARAAAQATRGEVLVHGSELVEAYFHASCGGRTERGADALGRDLPYLASVPCGRCNDSPGVRWTVSIAARELGALLGLGGPVTRVEVTDRTSTGRAAKIAVEAAGRRASLSGAEVRQRIGFSRLPSLAFEVSERRGTFTFAGRGRGHGAGLCQWGAAGMAREGKDYREILAHYYPGTELLRMY